MDRLYSEKKCKQKVDLICEPVNTAEFNGKMKSQTIKHQYQRTSFANILGYSSTYGATGVAESVCLRYKRTEEAKDVRADYEAGIVKHGYHELHMLQPRVDGKSNTISTVLKDNPIAEPVCVAQRGRDDGQHYEARTDGKTNVLTTVQKDNAVAERVKDEQ